MSDAALLTLSRWLSPAFPLGGFAYSHGIEAAISAGQVACGADVGAWVADVVEFGTGRIDAALLVAAMAPGCDHEALAAEARALAATRERWEESFAQGAAFTETVNALTGRADPHAALPVAVGRAAASLGLAPSQVAALYLQGFATNIVLAAVRFLPLGQTEGQRVLQALEPAILRTASAAAERPLQAMASEVPGADLAAMAHETLEVRIFRT